MDNCLFGDRAFKCSLAIPFEAILLRNNAAAVDQALGK